MIWVQNITLTILTGEHKKGSHCCRHTYSMCSWSIWKNIFNKFQITYNWWLQILNLLEKWPFSINTYRILCFLKYVTLSQEKKVLNEYFVHLVLKACCKIHQWFPTSFPIGSKVFGVHKFSSNLSPFPKVFPLRSQWVPINLPSLLERGGTFSLSSLGLYGCHYIPHLWLSL
jgi:hypothetical protein